MLLAKQLYVLKLKSKNKKKTPQWLVNSRIKAASSISLIPSALGLRQILPFSPDSGDPSTTKKDEEKQGIS